ncbi:aminotransferase-like domain-containing protein [Actinoplanes regularis]|uniref:DNA-binding transcriptional regulator, MocR family, contains an aminotransferase domain n=1 Tax=Actinoplanes regularis TaxID=52697 RepID=A0A239B634_9ACTN|nr:PLP-dependent aminotransferase family protein [Actinoplanes regularis]GIE87162.1 GntR family transcriptional regulator [Actinoplanes regularis]SNS02688.1 DNA-binding transcriptional regulator, MocR family, contains an aminotransferase domain [Actinoplanes regularis]
MTGTTQDDYTDRYARRVRGMTTSEIRALFSVASRPEVVSLAGGSPYIAALPLDAVGEMLNRLAVDHGTTSLQYGIGQGTVELRERICEVMALSGITNASPDDVVVTVGGQQALDLLARLFLDPGDVVLAEGPTYVGALGVFQAAQAQVRHVAMDDEGLIPEALEEAIAASPRAKFLYTIPTFQNPAGVTLSEERRERVLDICERAGLLVVEDDPYGMLSFEGDAPLPLRARRRDGVFYCSTFSKTFAPGLRVGWILAPHAVREKLVLASEANILCPSAFAQGAVTQYLTTMPWREQIKVYREIYRERRDALLSALTDLMPAGTTWTRPTGGLFVWATLPEGLDSKAMMPRAVAARVAYVPGTGFYADGTGRSNMRLNFSFATPERLREGVRRLSGVMEQDLAMRAVFGGSTAIASQRRRGPAAADAPGPDLA